MACLSGLVEGIVTEKREEKVAGERERERKSRFSVQVSLSQLASSLLKRFAFGEGVAITSLNITK